MSLGDVVLLLVVTAFALFGWFMFWARVAFVVTGWWFNRRRHAVDLAGRVHRPAQLAGRCRCDACERMRDLGLML